MTQNMSVGTHGVNQAARASSAVLLVDADFRQPALHRVFQVKSNLGLADVLSGDAELDLNRRA